MSEEPGLRERKKMQTALELWGTAVALFVERGFDNVSVAEIAASASVSKMTVFNYFGTKEDLVLRPMEEHVGEPAAAVRERAPGESAIAAIRRRYLTALAAFDPATGLNDSAPILNVQRLVDANPALIRRVYAFRARAEELLAAELAAQTGDQGLVPRLAAAQLMAVRNTLIAENSRRMLAGETPAAVLPEASAAAEYAFELLEHGLGDYCTLET